MKESTFVVAYVLLVALVPVFLAVNQEVPAGSIYKQTVLLISLAAFGLVLGQFWLSRLRPHRMVNVRPATVLRWHKGIGYSICGFLLIHPLLMIARRFWVEESDPVENLLLMLRAPSMLPAIVGWVLLVLLVVLSFARRSFRPGFWSALHGLLSAAFVGLSAWHVVAVGRHSNTAMSVLWVTSATAAIWVLLHSYLPSKSTETVKIEQGVTHEPA